MYRNISLNIVRGDKSVIDISWVKCIEGRSATPKENLISAMRFAIEGQRLNFREKHTKPYFCGLCSKLITDEVPEVDHYDPPFIVLANDFINQNKNVPKTFDDDKRSNNARFKKEDLDFENGWKNYHSKKAVLVLAHKKCNSLKGATEIK